ncbi:MAG: hypothetical protein IIC10_10790, partial [Proteobacteria bacterium]|nr:hypothetical protein [Pseudomonadota bacterium]
MRTHYSLLGLASFLLLTFQTQALAQSSAMEPLTYNGEIGRIINENCVVCHRQGGIGPMQLGSYDQVRPWAPLIQLRVANREMPPYAYDHGIGIQNLQGDWRLSQNDVDSIVSWVNQGAPLGDPDIQPPTIDLPDPTAWTFAAKFGEPDLIIASVAMDIPADGNDLWTKHYVDSGLTEDRCIKAVQVKPRGDAKAVVHHANTDIQVPNADGEFEDYGYLTEYAMGKWGEQMPEGVCRTLPKGSRVHWDIHMFPGGVGAMAQGFHSFDHPVRVDSYQPHGHLRMNAASLEIFYPATGRTEQISQISKWSATWHTSHIYHPDEAP